MRKGDVVLCIDPSTRALGWAIFETRAWEGVGELVTSNVFREGSDAGDWIVRTDLMILRLYLVAQQLRVTKAVIELPSCYSGGVGDVAGKSGSIMKLMGCVMAIREKLKSSLGIEVILVPVLRWKGTTPKEVTRKRVKRWWGWDGVDHNECDAVGIGDWYVRKMLRYEPAQC